MSADTCPVCDGMGDVLVNFDIHSYGVPDIIECPNCKGTGRSFPAPDEILSTEATTGGRGGC